MHLPRLPILVISTLCLLASPLLQAQPPHDRGPSSHNQGHPSGSPRHTDERSTQLFDEQMVRSVLRSQHQYLQPAEPLPPGIRRNLARGKPLPPGIARQFDARLNNQLPMIDGYEWRQVGTDAVLVAVTTGVIEAVIDSIFD